MVYTEEQIDNKKCFHTFTVSHVAISQPSGTGIFLWHPPTFVKYVSNCRQYHICNDTHPDSSPPETRKGLFYPQYSTNTFVSGILVTIVNAQTMSFLAAHRGKLGLEISLNDNRVVNSTNCGIKPRVPVDPHLILENWLPAICHGNAVACMQKFSRDQFDVFSKTLCTAPAGRHVL